MPDHLLDRFNTLAARRAADLGVSHDAGGWLATVELAVALVRTGTDPADLPVLKELALALADEALLDIVTGVFGVAWLAPRPDRSDVAARQLFAAVADASSSCAGAHVALARSVEQLGDLAGMERCLQRALRVDPDHRLANGDLGDLAALRGDFRGAWRHHRRGGRPPMGLTAVAASVTDGRLPAASAPAGGGRSRSPGRNDPCPCGSGARFKRCCDETGGWSLEARVEMLPTRLADWATRPAWARRRLRFAAEVAGVDLHAKAGAGGERGTPAVDEGAVRLMCHLAVAPGMLELHLYETGAFERLLDDVLPVLRTDEREAVAGWAACSHDLYEVAGRGPRSTTLLRSRTGDVHAVAGIDDDLLEADGTHVLAVVLPTGCPDRAPWVAGGQPIPVLTCEVGGVAAMLDAGRDPATLARAVLVPVAEGQRLVASLPADADRDERLRWLFGEGVDPSWVRDLGDVDDLVTTTYMWGGGFSEVADQIRHAARQLVEAEPPEVWTRAQELTAAGYDRETVLLHLAAAWVWGTRVGRHPDAVRTAHLAALRPPLAADIEALRRRRRDRPA